MKQVYKVKHVDGRYSVQTKPEGAGELIANDLSEENAELIERAINALELMKEVAIEAEAIIKTYRELMPTRKQDEEFNRKMAEMQRRL